MLEFHEYANLFPMMSAEEMDALRKDMRENGYRSEYPILLYEGKILDGRNRYTAATAEGIEPIYGDHQDGDALQFVISANLHRRHLDATQRGVVASRLANMQCGDTAYNLKNIDSANLQSRENLTSQSEAAEMLNVSPRIVATVKKIEREAPDLLPKMESGKMTAHAAEKEVRRREIVAERAEIAKQAEQINPSSRWEVIQADMQNWTTDKEFDFIITDPPYLKEYRHLYEVLAIRANEWLKPGGLVVAMAGQSYLDELYFFMSQHLDYYWTAAYLTPGQPTPLRQRNVNTTWKPLLIFSKGEYKGKIFGDVFKSDRNDKDFHKWGQSVSGMYDIVSKMCLKGQSILDPFCGAGTTGVAAMMHGCTFTGIELEEENVKLSRSRINDSQA